MYGGEGGMAEEPAGTATAAPPSCGAAKVDTAAADPSGPAPPAPARLPARPSSPPPSDLLRAGGGSASRPPSAPHPTRVQVYVLPGTESISFLIGIKYELKMF